MQLFTDMGAGRMMRKLAWAGRGAIVAIPSEEALSNARARVVVQVREHDGLHSASQRRITTR